jgi:hypothetical protein
VLVCDSVVVDCDDVLALEDVSDVSDVSVVSVVEPTVVVVAAVASSLSLVELAALVPFDVLPVLAAAAVDEVVVALWPSRQASAPPSESIVATLRAVAALRARAARGLRRPRVVRRTGGGGAVGSSMTVNVRTRGEWSARGG